MNNNEKSLKESKSKIIVPIILSSLVTLIITFSVGYFYCENYLNKGITKTKLQKDVTVTDEGIADAVEKIYDAVVVVENYNNGTLYSTGTGFIYKKDNKKAYILTNYHVINNASEIYVIDTDDVKTKVELVGGDEYSDIAVLSIDVKEDIAVAAIGSSEDLRVGDTTFAVGAPLDAATYSWTVTR
ncbi:MAG TPA: trypsin-like peptidase domain-containing protein, partial [Bacilli bacterium]|nr:trypsin-like peptidase domain-containing protein [Bacilli bacterium]